MTTNSSTATNVTGASTNVRGFTSANLTDAEPSEAVAWSEGVDAPASGGGVALSETVTLSEALVVVALRSVGLVEGVSLSEVISAVLVEEAGLVVLVLYGTAPPATASLTAGSPSGTVILAGTSPPPIAEKGS